MVDVALVLVDDWPVRNSWFVQLVLENINDYFPTPESVQPSVDIDATVLVDFGPAGHSRVTYKVLEPAKENWPNSMYVQPSALEGAVSKVEY